MLFGALLVKDDFHIADCATETFAIEYVVYLGQIVSRAVCD